MTAYQALRTRQIQICSRLLGRLEHSRYTRFLSEKLGRVPGVSRALVGYRRPFATLEDARQALGNADGGAHDNPDGIALHANLSEKPRLSDYAAFYYLAPLAPRLRRIFDVGGSVGNLYYYYSKYLPLPSDAEWLALDLPAVVEQGRRMAHERQATGIGFTTEFADAENSDLIIASGSAHYFDDPLPLMIGRLGKKPPHVLVNRTPMTDHPDFATVQDARSYRVACMVRNRANFIKLFEDMGYRLAGHWEAPELSICVPLHPDRSVKGYTGMFFTTD